eukprot:scaffold5625_cov126-Isochrysis_galbana.AAC.3
MGGTTLENSRPPMVARCQMPGPSQALPGTRHLQAPGTHLSALSKKPFLAFLATAQHGAAPTYASALTGDFLSVPPSPKRPREVEQPEVRRTAQPWAWPWPGSNVTIDIGSAVVSLNDTETA